MVKFDTAIEEPSEVRENATIGASVREPFLSPNAYMLFVITLRLESITAGAEEVPNVSPTNELDFLTWSRESIETHS